MAKIQDKGLNDYIKSIKRMGKVSDDIIHKITIFLYRSNPHSLNQICFLPI